MNKKRILIIDDDEDFIESIKVILGANDFEVSSARNIKKGLEIIEQASPNLIIMDVMMEKMCDGFDFSRKLKADDEHKNIPIFILTSVKQVTGFKFSDAAGDKRWLPVDDYAEKPIPPNELISRINKLLSK